jgi:hypothetical protein
MGIVLVLAWRGGRCRTKGDNDVYLASEQCISQLREAIRPPFRILALYGDALSFGITELVQSFQEGIEHVARWIGKL